MYFDSESNVSIDNDGIDADESLENGIYESLIASNLIKAANDDNPINFEDSYPHVNYEDYGIFNNFNDSTIPTVENTSPSTQSTLSMNNEVPTVKSLIPNITIDYNITTHHIPDVRRIFKCCDRICINKTVRVENFSGKN